MIKRSAVLRVAGEGTLIVVSVLVALTADAWLEQRRQRSELAEHVTALSRDFMQMASRAEESLRVATEAADAGRYLLGAIREGVIDTDATYRWFGRIQNYEVFSPSIGAYQTLVATGDIELLPDPSLKRELAEFFGSFEDMRASERLLLETQARFQESSAFAQLAGKHRDTGYDIAPVRSFSMEEWARSPEMLNGIAMVVVRQADVAEDYRFLVQRLNTIQESLSSLGTG